MRRKGIGALKTYGVGISGEGEVHHKTGLLKGTVTKFSLSSREVT